MIIGTIHHDYCCICGNQTVDADGHCHYAYCGMQEVDDNGDVDYGYPPVHYNGKVDHHDQYTVSERLGMDGHSEADFWDGDDSHGE